MKIIVPHTESGLHPITKALLRSYGMTPEFVLLDGHIGYGRLLCRLWETQETFVIVEHDILPWPGAIEELFACPCEWGTYSYRQNGGTGIAHMLGCAKITRNLINKLPNIWHDDCHWADCDSKLFFQAREQGIEPHLHRPPVIHLNQRELGGF